MSIKDLRGPAQAVIMRPSNFLIMTGIAGFIGWLGLLVIILIPILFPLKPDTNENNAKEALSIDKGLEYIAPAGPFVPGGMMGGGGTASKKVEEEDESFFELGPVDLMVIADESVLWIILYLSPIILCLCYSGTMTFGAVKMQNLESRQWGIAACIMGMLPINIGALMFVSGLLLRTLMWLFVDEMSTRNMFVVIWMVILWLGSIAVSVYALVTLMREDVIAGYEYVAE
jgi:hypothetical protein